MEADERQRRILALARHDGRVEVASLADDLSVAPETVRRDLRQLVERGMLQRVHGGAHPVEGAGYESDVCAPRATSRVAEKRRIADAAASPARGRRVRSSSTRASRRRLVAEAVVTAMASRSDSSPSSPRRCPPPTPSPRRLG